MLLSFDSLCKGYPLWCNRLVINCHLFCKGYPLKIRCFLANSQSLCKGYPFGFLLCSYKFHLFCKGCPWGSHWFFSHFHPFARVTHSDFIDNCWDCIYFARDTPQNFIGLLWILIYFEGCLVGNHQILLICHLFCNGGTPWDFMELCRLSQFWQGTALRNWQFLLNFSAMP